MDEVANSLSLLRHTRARGGLTSEERALAFNAPTVAGQRPVVAYHAMAGNGHSEMVGGACLRDCADGAWCPNLLRNVCVAGGGADWDSPQCLPDLLLESGAAYVERQIETARRCFNEADYGGYQALKIGVATKQLGLGEAVLEITYQGLRIVT